MRRLLILATVAIAAACGSGASSSLALGAAAPDFSLPGIDGQTHRLADYAASQVLSVVFMCNHCPASQQYERRIQKLYEDYRGKGVAVVAINPNAAESLTPLDLKYSDGGDSLADMKARAAFRHLDFPYLYDGDAQVTSKAFKVVATPQIFVFDKTRTLRYQGRIDDNISEPHVKSADARRAIDAMLASQPVKVAETEVVGCPPVWKAPAPAGTPAASPIGVDMATADVLKALRTNGTSKYLLVNFWATWCGPCVVEFPDLVMTSRMYRDRALEFVTVSENQPDEREQVLAFLLRHQATNRNLLFATPDTYALQDAFDKAMPAALPFTLLLAPNGDVLYQELGSLDVLKLTLCHEERRRARHRTGREDHTSEKSTHPEPPGRRPYLTPFGRG
jgi:thiol-disulfide isomerase/thioredoxin